MSPGSDDAFVVQQGDLFYVRLLKEAVTDPDPHSTVKDMTKGKMGHQRRMALCVGIIKNIVCVRGRYADLSEAHQFNLIRMLVEHTTNSGFKTIFVPRNEIQAKSDARRTNHPGAEGVVPPHCSWRPWRARRTRGSPGPSAGPDSPAGPSEITVEGVLVKEELEEGELVN